MDQNTTQKQDIMTFNAMLKLNNMTIQIFNLTRKKTPAVILKQV